MKNFLKVSFASATLLALPLVAGAQTDGINHLINQVQNIIARLIPIVIGIALLVFLWGVIWYVISNSDEDKKKARGYMIWGVIGLFVMTAVWGLVSILTDSIFQGRDINAPPSNPGFTQTTVN